jgi:hypothetical protein
LGAGVPENMQLLVDLLNNRIAPVAYARGTLGEADFPAMSDNIEAAMIGHGEVYCKGVRMKAAQALDYTRITPSILACDSTCVEAARAAPLADDTRCCSPGYGAIYVCLHQLLGMFATQKSAYPAWMPSYLHELILLLFRNRSESAADLLRKLDVEPPEHDEVSAESSDLNGLRPAEYRADLVLFLLRRTRKVLGIIVEVQLGCDDDKPYA